MKGRVLVVDDDLALSEMLGIVLRNEGLDVVHCANGSSAMALFRESRPDIVPLPRSVAPVEQAKRSEECLVFSILHSLPCFRRLGSAPVSRVPAHRRTGLTLSSSWSMISISNLGKRHSNPAKYAVFQ